MRAATRSNLKGAYEFIVHVDKEYDYRFISEQRDEIFKALKYVYHKETGKNLPIYGVNYPSLKNFETSKKHMKAGVFILPPDVFRIRSEDIFNMNSNGISNGNGYAK